MGHESDLEAVPDHRDRTCIAGAVLGRYIPELYLAVVGGLGAGAETGKAVLDILLTLIRWTMLPLGTTLIGVAIVVETLLGVFRREQPGESDHR